MGSDSGPQKFVVQPGPAPKAIVQGLKPGELPPIAVLLIDDHPLFAEGVQATLMRRDSSLRVDWARTLEAGLTRLADGSYSLVLLDLRLPDVEGLDGFLAVRGAYPDLPVAVLSGMLEPGMARELVTAGAQGVMGKDLAPEVLVDAVRLILDGGIYVPPRLLLDAAPPAVRTRSGSGRGAGEAEQAGDATRGPGVVQRGHRDGERGHRDGERGHGHGELERGSGEASRGHRDPGRGQGHAGESGSRGLSPRARDWLRGAGASAQEIRVAELMCQGQSNKEIARALKLQEGTVKVYVSALLRILGVNNRVRATLALHAM